MDGKILLMTGAALLAAIAYMGTTEMSFSREETGPSQPPSRLNQPADIRHDNIRAMLSDEGADLDNPNSYEFEREGFTLIGGPVAATEHRTLAWISDIFSWHLPPDPEATPSALKWMPLLPGCQPQGPAPGSRLAHVYSGPTFRPVSVWAYSQAELQGEAEALIARIRAEGSADTPSMADKMRGSVLSNNTSAAPEDRYQFSLFDVAVTETERPVHLVLQAGGGRVMWNLSLAPGARLSGLTLLGGDMVAIANMPRDVPFEVMTRPALDACGLRPSRALRETDPIFGGLDAGLIDIESARLEAAQHAQRVEDWNTWFREHFGLRADETRIGHDIGGIAALVGPLPPPNERVGWHGFDGRTVKISPHFGAMKHSKMGPSARFKLRVEKKAEQILGADLSTLTPKGVN